MTNGIETGCTRADRLVKMCREVEGTQKREDQGDGIEATAEKKPTKFEGMVM